MKQSYCYNVDTLDDKVEPEYKNREGNEGILFN